MRMARAERKADYDSRWVIEELIDNVKQAKEKGDINASTNALKLLGIEKRMFTDRKEVGQPGDFENAESIGEVLGSMSPELQQQLANLLLEITRSRPTQDDINQANKLLNADTPTDSVN